MLEACEWLRGGGRWRQQPCLAFSVGLYFDIFTLFRENSTQRSSSAMKRTRKEHLWTVALLNAKSLPLHWIILRPPETLFKGFAKYSLWKRTNSILNSRGDQKWPWVKLWTRWCLSPSFYCPFPVSRSPPPSGKLAEVSWGLPPRFLFASCDWAPGKDTRQ